MYFDVQRAKRTSFACAGVFEDDGSDGARGEDGEIFDCEGPGEEVWDGVDGVC